jgi:hypothetical protein
MTEGPGPLGVTRARCCSSPLARPLPLLVSHERRAIPRSGDAPSAMPEPVTMPFLQGGERLAGDAMARSAQEAADHSGRRHRALLHGAFVPRPF